MPEKVGTFIMIFEADTVRMNWVWSRSACRIMMP